MLVCEGDGRLQGQDVQEQEQQQATSEPEDSYQASKERLHRLKQQQAQVLGAQCARAAAESAALVEQRLAHEAREAELHSQVAGLREQLKQNLERSTKLRHAAEREKKGLQGQLDKALRELDGIEGQHAREVEQLGTGHEERVAALQHQLTEARALLEVQRTEARGAQEAAVLEVEQWCQGEVEALKHVLGSQVEAQTATAERWQQQHAAEAHKRGAAEEALGQAEERLQGIQEENAALAAELGVLQQHVEAQQAAVTEQAAAAATAQADALASLQAKHTAEVAALKANHVRQLDNIDTRLHEVLGRKDQAIAALQEELGGVYAKLQQFERLAG